MTNACNDSALPPKGDGGPDAPISRVNLWICGLSLVILWGTAYNMITVGVRHMSPIWLVAWRSIFGAVLVTAYAYYRGHRFPKFTDVRWIWYLCFGVTGMVIPFFLVAEGQLTVDSGVSAIIVGSMPIMTIILAHFYANEPLTWRTFFGFVVGFCGIVILFLPENFSFELIKDWKAQLFIVGAAFCYAVTTIAAKRAPETPASLGAAMMILGAAISSTIIALFTSPIPAPSFTGYSMALALGIGSTGIASIIYFYVLNKTGPSMVAKINYFTPLAALVPGVLLLGEPFTLRTVVAFLTIIVGVMITRTGKPS